VTEFRPIVKGGSFVVVPMSDWSRLPTYIPADLFRLLQPDERCNAIRFDSESDAMQALDAARKALPAQDNDQ